jgi:hypothetical protein
MVDQEKLKGIRKKNEAGRKDNFHARPHGEFEMITRG